MVCNTAFCLSTVGLSEVLSNNQREEEQRCVNRMMYVAVRGT